MHLDTTILLDQLKLIDGYPFDPAKDQPFLIELLIEFPNVDFLEELKRLKLWITETKPFGRVHYRLLLRTWIRNASINQNQNNRHNQK
jgi:hypothetical protein